MRHAPAPQPSSTTTTLRALVMLVCLVGIPIIAVRGTAVPAMIREYLIQKLGGAVPEPEIQAELAEAPPFVPPPAGSNQPSAAFPFAAATPSAGTILQPATGSAEPYAAPSSNRPASSYDQFQSRTPYGSSSAPQMAHQGPVGYTGNSEAVLANYDSPPGLANDSTPPTPMGYPPRDTEGRVHGYVESFPSGQNPPPQVAQSVGGVSTVDQFVHIEKRLRELGAEYYLLENWGNQGECYRFHCRIAVANSANFTKHFEATDSQPLGAMTQVLADVESWRRGGPVRESLPIPPATPASNGLPGGAPVQAISPHGPYAR